MFRLARNRAFGSTPCCAPIAIRSASAARTNIQDGCILHADPGFPCTIGDGVTVGHGAIVHGATVENDVLIGMRAVVMNGARIGSGQHHRHRRGRDRRDANSAEITGLGFAGKSCTPDDRRRIRTNPRGCKSIRRAGENVPRLTRFHLCLTPHAPETAQAVAHNVQPPCPAASSVPQPGPQPSAKVSENFRNWAAAS